MLLNFLSGVALKLIRMNISIFQTLNGISMQGYESFIFKNRVPRSLLSLFFSFKSICHLSFGSYSPIINYSLPLKAKGLPVVQTN